LSLPYPTQYKPTPTHYIPIISMFEPLPSRRLHCKSPLPIFTPKQLHQPRHPFQLTNPHRQNLLIPTHHNLNPEFRMKTHRLNNLSTGRQTTGESLLSPSTIHSYCTISSNSHFCKSIWSFLLRPVTVIWTRSASSWDGQDSTGGVIE
jgi:hypothetical protein